MTGDAFVEYAEQALAGPKPSEAACRTAVSRAYYGVFHIASKLLRDAGVQIGDRHITVWNCLQASKYPAAVEARYSLSDLSQERVRADYRIDDASWGQLAFAQECVVEAQEIAKLLTQCQSAMTEIRQGIEAYRRQHGGRLP
jgi:hypothetical protein